MCHDMIRLTGITDNGHMVRLVVKIYLSKIKIHKMKTKNLVLSVAIAVAILAFSCSKIREQTAEELLEGPKMEGEIYSAILNDSAHFANFMDKMMSNEKCKGIMVKHQGMMKMMCTAERVDSMMNADTEMLENMMSCMIKRMEGDTSACNRMYSKMMNGDATRKKMMDCCKNGEKNFKKIKK